MEHTPAKELRERLDEGADRVVAGDRYAHYKHPESAYRIIGLGLLEANEEVAVIYKQEEGEHLTFIRPLRSFLETVETPEGLVPRFIRL